MVKNACMKGNSGKITAFCGSFVPSKDAICSFRALSKKPILVSGACPRPARSPGPTRSPTLRVLLPYALPYPTRPPTLHAPPPCWRAPPMAANTCHPTLATPPPSQHHAPPSPQNHLQYTLNPLERPARKPSASCSIRPAVARLANCASSSDATE
jgi:hypothetical protein